MIDMPVLQRPNKVSQTRSPSVSSSRRKPVQSPNVYQSKILIIDDESLNIDVVQTYLEMEGYDNIQSTVHSTEALELISRILPDLILLDINMPEVSGMQILEAIRADDLLSTIPVIILTANSTSETKLEALEHGATDLLSKPVHHGELLARIRNVLNLKSYQDQLCRYSESLESAVRERTADLEKSRMEVIHCLARAAEFRDDDTGRHIIRVGRYARIIGQELGLSETHLESLQAAAQLHDVGKIGIPDSVLLKAGKLTPEEFALMQKHCEYGGRIVDSQSADEIEIIRAHTNLGALIVDVGSSPLLKMAKRIAMTHHERWDGTGYPSGLAGEEIPLEGRITAVADVFDALSSKRSYKPAFPLAKCLQILSEGRGTQFDPAVIDAFFARQEEIVETQISLSDAE